MSKNVANILFCVIQGQRMQIINCFVLRIGPLYDDYAGNTVKQPYNGAARRSIISEIGNNFMNILT